MNPVSSIILLLAVCILLVPLTSQATTPPCQPVTSVQSVIGDTLGIASNVRFHNPRATVQNFRRDIDNYYGSFRRICAFLNTMQEPDENDASFGGLHEGEGNREWDIIETDNTQESIRDWCLYALIFNDSDTYRENVAAAWTYCHNFPAWEESEPNWYGLHNSGWGLMAEMAYREAYGDGERDYGLNCAEHLVEHTPEIQVDMENPLMPLVAGWAAGTLYIYGDYEDNEEFRDAALRIGSEVKNWIDANVERLNANETWALCGGTAMWGVLNSLGGADSAETADWAVDVLDRMDVFAGRGDWNNSWNIWYAHAWIAAWKLTGDDEYLANAITIVDSLLSQDGDRDGGIPATGGDGDSEDQSWVTAYTAWMGLSNLFEVLPDVNVSLINLVEPSLNRSYPIGSPLNFSFIFTNGGAMADVESPFRIRGAWEMDTTVVLGGWDDFEFMLAPWIPDEVGQMDFTAFMDHEDDAFRTDDSLYFSLEILPVGRVSLLAVDANRQIIDCYFSFYNLEINPDAVFAEISTDTTNGIASMELMVGTYKIEIVPVYPYPRRTIQRLEITERSWISLTEVFEQPSVLLIERDLDSRYVSYYEDALNECDRTFYLWSSELLGEFSGRTDGFHTLIYFTGDRVEDVILPEDQQEISDFLDSGGNLFITGQNISDDLAGSEFLSQALHCRHITDNMDRPIVNGVAGDILMDGKRLFLFGNGGANNQFSEAGIYPLGDALAVALYDSRGDTAAAIRWETESGGKAVFFAFGFEGISGAGDTEDREQVMSAILDWFETPRRAPLWDMQPLPVDISATIFPNPSNGGVTIAFNGLSGQRFDLTIHDLNGRLIRRIDSLTGNTAFWDGRDMSELAVPSGIYYFNLLSPGSSPTSVVGKVVLIR